MKALVYFILNFFRSFFSRNKPESKLQIEPENVGIIYEQKLPELSNRQKKRLNREAYAKLCPSVTYSFKSKTKFGGSRPTQIIKSNDNRTAIKPV